MGNLLEIRGSAEVGRLEEVMRWLLAKHIVYMDKS